MNSSINSLQITYRNFIKIDAFSLQFNGYIFGLFKYNNSQILIFINLKILFFLKPPSDEN